MNDFDFGINDEDMGICKRIGWKMKNMNRVA
jgi:hypothetical protein